MHVARGWFTHRFNEFILSLQGTEYFYLFLFLPLTSIKSSYCFLVLNEKLKQDKKPTILNFQVWG